MRTYIFACLVCPYRILAANFDSLILSAESERLTPETTRHSSESSGIVHHVGSS